MKTPLTAVILLAFSMAGTESVSATSGRIRASETQIVTFKTALNMFDVECGRYPSTEEGLEALIRCPTNMPADKWRGPFLEGKTIPLDPWGHPYIYRCPGIHNTNNFDIYSCGPDGISKSGGDDEDDFNTWRRCLPHELREMRIWAAALAAWALFPLISIAGMWGYRKVVNGNSNCHGAITWFWFSAVVATFCGMRLVTIPENFVKPLAVLLLVSLGVPGGLAESALNRGRLLGRLYWLAVTVACLLLSLFLYLVKKST